VNSYTSNSEEAKMERSMVRRFLLRYALPFCILFAVAALTWDWLLREQVIFRTETHGAAKLNRIMAKHPGEVAILGSSRALGSYIPDSLFPSAYNYGINGIGYRVMDLFLEKELQSGNTAPILVNFDYQMFVGSGGDPTNYLPFTSDPQIWQLMGDLGLQAPFYRIPGLRFYGGLDGYMREFLNQRMQLTKWVTRGASIEKNVLPQDHFEKLVKQRLDEPSGWTPDSILIGRFRQRIQQGKDRQWYIVVAPYHWSYYQSFHPGQLVTAKAFLHELDQLPQVKVIEINGATWPDSLFANTTHINLAGALRFNRELRPLLSTDDSTPTPPAWPL